MKHSPFFSLRWTRTALLIAASLFAAVPGAWATSLELATGPYLQPAGPGAMAVVWVTESPCTSWVTLRAEGEKGEKKVVPTDQGLVLYCEHIHKVLLTDLAVGRTYSYVIHWRSPASEGSGEGGAALGPFTFRLPTAEEPLTFVAFTDIHGNDALLDALAKQSGAHGADLVTLIGDGLDYLLGEAGVVNHILTPFTEITGSSKPFVWVRGNHETRGTFAYHMKDYLALPGGRYYHTFTAGPVFFIALDSGEDKPDNHPEYRGLADFDRYRAEEKAWFEKVLRTEACKEAGFRVVLVHDPPSGGGYTSKVIRSWVPLMNDAGVDLLIAGHLHDARICEEGTASLNCPIVQCGGRKLEDGAAARVEVAEGKMHVRLIDAEGKSKGEITVP